MSSTRLVCLTPMKNEAWILRRFLACASLWADEIIVADQGSEDGSREIARSFPKVRLIDNVSPVFNEPERQKLLIDAARTTAGPRILIALDADEILTANFSTSSEWLQVRETRPGTVIRFNRVEIRPDVKNYWMTHHFALGFADDGSPHRGAEIHSTRLPTPDGAPILDLEEVCILHYQCTDWNRMASKRRWYLCWERVHRPHRSAVTNYREYHHMDAIPENRLQPLAREWLEPYEHLGIDMASSATSSSYHWDREVLALFARHGVQCFRREAIWDVDWNRLRSECAAPAATVVDDPRSFFERQLHHWLRLTQPYYRPPAARFLAIRTIDKLLRGFF